MTDHQRRCYVPTDSGTVSPEVCALLVCDPIALADGSYLLKVRRALVPLAADVDGALLRTLPDEIQKLATGPALGSEAAARVITTAEAQAMTIAEIKAKAAEVAIDLGAAKLKSDIVAAYVAGCCGAERVEMAPLEVIEATQPALWADIVTVATDAGRDPEKLSAEDVKIALAAVSDGKVLGAVEELQP